MLFFQNKEGLWFIKIDKINELLILMIEVFSSKLKKVDQDIEVLVSAMVERLILPGEKKIILELEIISFLVFGIAIDFLI